jgi:hypothetical protein
MSLPGYAGSETALQITAQIEYLDRVEGPRASKLIGDAGDQWPSHLSGDPDQLFSWCLTQPQDRLLKLLALCAAQTVDAVQKKADRPECSRLQNASHLAEA